MGRKLSKSPHLLIGPLMEDDGGSPRNCLTAFESIVCTNHGHTPPETNIAPEKGLFQWEIHLATIIFQGIC